MVPASRAVASCRLGTLAVVLLLTPVSETLAVAPFHSTVEPGPSVDPQVYSQRSLVTDPRIEPGLGSGARLLPGPDSPPLLDLLESFSIDDVSTATGGVLTTPPDPIGAAGIDHLVAVGNVVIEWRDKLGGPRTLQSLQGFFGAATLTFDPKVIYDQHNDRFVVITLEQTEAPAASTIYVAVSQTADPNGGWHITAIDSKLTFFNSELGLTTEHWADYPGLAVDDGAIYVTNNMFTFSSLVGVNTFGDSRLWIIQKGEGSGGFYDGGAATVNVYDPSNGSGGTPTEVFTLQPAHIFGANPGLDSVWLTSAGWSQDFGLAAPDGDEALLIIRIDDPLTGPAFSGQFVVAGDIEDARQGMPNAPQLACDPVAGEAPLVAVETNDRRSLHSVWRNDRLYVCSTTVPYLGDDAGEATAHWFSVDTSTPATLTVIDQGDVGGEDIAPDMHTFFPSLAVDGLDNLAIGFAASNAVIHPGAYYVLREAGDPPGTVQPTVTLATGVDCYRRTFGSGRNRWGDYSGISIDPVDDATVWVFNEYALERGTPTSSAEGDEYGRWGTRWGAFQSGDPDLTVTAFESPCCAALGEEIGDRVLVRIANIGPTDAAVNFRVGVYVSPDADISTADDLLIGGREIVLSLAAGAEIIVPVDPIASIPDPTFLGDVFLGVIVDELDEIAESDENNNTAANPVHIAPSAVACLEAEATSANEDRTVSVYVAPDGSGNALSAAQFWDGIPGSSPSIVDATITVAVRDEDGNPISGVVVDLLSSLGGLQICAGLPASDGPTDGLGRATFSGTVFGGGFTDPTEDEHTWIQAVGSPLAQVRYGPARMLASDTLGEIYEIDLSTGAASSLYLPFTAGATEIEYDAVTGRTWIQQPGANFNGRFFDPFTGVALTPLLSTAGWAFNGLEYIDGQLHGTGIENSCGLSSLSALDPENGFLGLIGATGAGPLTGLAWNPICRKLYAVSGCRLQFGTSVLSEIDRATGVSTPIFDTGVVLGALEFGADGVLYGAEAGTDSTSLYRIDPLAGTVSLVGPTGILGANTGGGVSGLTLVSDPGLKILFNSADLNSDLVVNIADVGDLSIAFNSLAYSYAIDYVYDGVNNIADVGTFALALGTSCPVVPKQVAMNAPEGEMGIAFDERGMATAIDLSPGTLTTAWLIVRGPAAEMGLRAWEAAIETTPNVVIEDWSLIEGSLDVGRAGDFHVGLSAPLAAAQGEALALASLRFRVLDDAPAHFFVRPVERSSVDGAGPAASVGWARGRLSLLTPSSGSSDVPVAYVNDDAREEQSTPAVVAVDLRNAPNPFNPSTEIRFNLPHGGDVELRIYDLAGRLVQKLHSGELSAGAHAVQWNGTDARGASVVSGTYMYQLLLDEEKIGEIGKMVLLK